MNKRVMIIVFLSIFIGVSVFVSYSQDKRSIVEKADKSINLLKVINRDGWDIPNIDTTETYQNKIIYFQDIPVTSKNYSLERTFDKEMESYSLDVENNLVIKSLTIEVKYITFYSVREKSFAFGIFGSPFGYFPNGSRGGIGILYKVFYFDEDGDGKFETRYNAIEVPRHIPSWVTESN